jgi:transcriptional regulator with XRE-family HTH domain
MKLADKISKLRKQIGWSQEELAEKMNVSRQSVSKWESASSIPDMNKIIRLSEIFSVSTDYLLKDEIETSETNVDEVEEDVVRINLETAREFVQSKIKTSKIIAIAVLIFIYSAIPLFSFIALSESGRFGLTENVAVGIGLVSTLILVAIGVVIAISSGQYKEHFELFEENDIELEYGLEGIFKDELRSYKGTYTRSLSISMTLFILSAVPLIMSGLLDAPSWISTMMMCLTIFIVGIGVYILIPAVSKYDAYNRILGKGDYSPTKKQLAKKSQKIGAFYWPLVTAGYLGWSFLTMDWHITWIVWPVAGVLFPAIIGLYNILKDDEE